MKIKVCSETEFRQKTEDLKNRSFRETSFLEGKIYTFEKKITDKKARIFLAVVAVFATVSTFFLALLSPAIRDLWSGAFLGKKVVHLEWEKTPTEKKVSETKEKVLQPLKAPSAEKEVTSIHPDIQRTFGKTNFLFIKGSVVEQKISVDAIVNAANESLLGGGGVDREIHKAARPSLNEECLEIKRRELTQYGGNCPVGYAVISGAHGIKNVKHIIHTVGPKPEMKNWKEKLEECYKSCLVLATEKKLESIAFCSIGTGIFGCPLKEAAPIALKTIEQYCRSSENTSLKEVRLFMFTDEEYEAFKKVLEGDTFTS